MENNQPLIFDDLKAADPDRALLSLFAPVETRFAVQVIDLWNAEIARIRDEVREPHMGVIRLQWWRDEIGRICSGGRSDAHPVLGLLSIVIPAYGLSFEFFDATLRSREFEFEDRAAESVEELAAYAQGIHAPVLNLKREILHCVQDDITGLARDYALIGIVRSVPFHAQMGRRFIPIAKDQREIVREICKIVPHPTLSRGERACRYFRATDVLARLYLKQIEAAGYDPTALKTLAFKELRVWFKSL